MTTAQFPASGPAEPLSPALDKTFKIGLVLKDKLWAYRWLIALLLAFIAYQLYQIIAVHFSFGLAALTVFDAALVWLTWREYRAKRARAHLPPGAEPAFAPAPPGPQTPCPVVGPGRPGAA